MKRNFGMAATAAIMLVCGLTAGRLFPDILIVDFLSGMMIGGSIVMNAMTIINYSRSNKFSQWKKSLFKIGA